MNRLKAVLPVFVISFLLFAASDVSTYAGIVSLKPVSQDTSISSDKQNAGINKQSNTLMIDTAAVDNKPAETILQTDTASKTDSTLIEKAEENVMTNTKLFVYILLSVAGLGLFFFIFVINLFKTFHKKRSTRQSLLLCWSLFFVISLVWIFIEWGLLAGFWITSSFTVIMIFLFIISLIMTIIAIKSK